MCMLNYCTNTVLHSEIVSTGTVSFIILLLHLSINAHYYKQFTYYYCKL